jgi:hypothetical protein
MLGASRKRQETHAPDRADDIADIVLKDHTGRDVRLGDFWSSRPAVLAFLRHYG